MLVGPVILFACIHNSGRSVAAAALTGQHAGNRVVVLSAGSEPAGGVDSVVAQVLAERGLRSDSHVPTLLDRDIVEAADVVITMGCGESCPVFPGKRYEDWTVDDPAGQDTEAVRRIVDDIDNRVRRLLGSLPGFGVGGGPGRTGPGVAAPHEATATPSYKAPSSFGSPFA